MQEMTADRREPVARYVLFREPSTQARFVTASEAAYATLVHADRWSGPMDLTVPSAPPAEERRGLFRRAQRVPTPPRTLAVTAALAEAGSIALEVPAQVSALGGCAAGQRLSSSLGQVVMELIDDLARGSVGQQSQHPAYTQTLRLAAELSALHTVTAEVGCLDRDGCVAARPPEHWGRRQEDVEVAEVRAVLLQLASASERSGA